MAVTTSYNARRSIASAGSMLPVHSFGSRGTPRFTTVTEAFYHHAVTQPETDAAWDLASSKGPTKITYRDLSARSARLASNLRRLGVTPGERVPVVVKRGIDMLVSIIAVLSCGAQYVPLDGGVVPDTTLRFVIEQTGGNSGVVLALNSTKHRLTSFEGVKVVVVDDDEDTSETIKTANGGFLNLAKPTDGCYIIYTSGKAWCILALDYRANRDPMQEPLELQRVST
jgi:acyl-CoA synthetase (AMP-forming)/AMP-acid ligase II